MQQPYLAATICTLTITGWLSLNCSGATDCKKLGTCHDSGLSSTAAGGGDQAPAASNSSSGGGSDGTGKYPNGADCNSGSECSSGFCADGVCCNAACDTSCASCALLGHQGQCTPYLDPADKECAQPNCRDILTVHPEASDGVYWLDPGGPDEAEPFKAYCNMTDYGGGWTLAMKVKGDTTTFAYDSILWENHELLNPGNIDIDLEENAKLKPWNTVPFTQIMVGMRKIDTPNTLEYRVLDISGDTLHDLFTANPQTTELGRNQWLSMVPEMTVQGDEACDMEGINIVFNPTENGIGYSTSVRIGIVASVKLPFSCAFSSSYVGLGGRVNAFCDAISPIGQYVAGSVTCNNPMLGVPAFAVLLVRQANEDTN